MLCGNIPVHDLHSNFPVVHEFTSPENRQRRFIRHATKFGYAVGICLAIWVLSGFGYFWPMWVIVIGGLKLGCEARNAYGHGHFDRARDDELAHV